MKNIAEILKNAPQGLKLYSLVHGDVTLSDVDDNYTEEDYNISVNTKNCTECFTKYGEMYCDYDDAECILFPSKDKTWDNWQEVLFQVGDIVINQKYQNKVMFIIIKKYDNTFTLQNSVLTMSNVVINNYRYATPEEREQFFKELNKNGYTWNDNTKQMEKSLQNTPKYKVGDYIVGDNETIYKIMDIHSTLYTLYDYSNQNKFKQTIKKIDENYSLVTDQELIDVGIKNQHHKFKAGDVIRNKETGTVRRISYLDTNRYILYKYNDEGMTGLNYENEDKWELVTEDKTKSESHYITPHRKFFNWIFDRLVNVHGENPNVDYMLSLKERIDDLFPETEETGATSEPTEEKSFTIEGLKPFDKVLVKYDSYSKWGIDFFERYDYNSKNNTPGPYICLSSSTHYCIPYNSETKHLLGTTDDCPEKYKTWED